MNIPMFSLTSLSGSEEGGEYMFIHACTIHIGGSRLSSWRAFQRTDHHLAKRSHRPEARYPGPHWSSETTFRLLELPPIHNIYQTNSVKSYEKSKFPAHTPSYAATITRRSLIMIKITSRKWSTTGSAQKAGPKPRQKDVQHKVQGEPTRRV